MTLRGGAMGSSSNTSAFLSSSYRDVHVTRERGRSGSSLRVNRVGFSISNTNFPTSSTLVWKKFYYDTLSIDRNAAGQTNKGKRSYSESYRLGTLVIRTSYSYDNMGRVAWMVESGFGQHYQKLPYTYDLAGNITRKSWLDWVDGGRPAATTYSYDQAGRLTAVYDSSSGGNVHVGSWRAAILN